MIPDGIISAVAYQQCALCFGNGIFISPRGRKRSICKCALRKIFKICFNRYTHYTNIKTTERLTAYIFKANRVGIANEKTLIYAHSPMLVTISDFIADFENVVKKTLMVSELKLFNLHFLQGQDYNYCCGRLNLNRGNFFHAVYRIITKIGKAIVEMSPYSLFPIDSYFCRKDNYNAPKKLAMAAGRA